MWGYVLLGVLLVCYLMYRRRIRHLLQADEMFPGPFALPIVGNVYQLLMNRSDMPKFGEACMWFYRRSFRLWVFDKLAIIIFDSKAVEKVFGSTEHLEKADQYNYLLDWIGRGLLTSYGPKWKKSRKILTPAFHFSILENFLEIFHRNEDVLLKKLSDRCGKNVNVYELIKHYALDVICESAMGVTVNAQLNPDSEYVKSIKQMCEIVFSRALSPWLWPDFIFKLSPQGKRQKRALSIIHGLTIKVIAQRRQLMINSTQEESDSYNDEGIKKKKVFMDILLQSSEDGGLTDEEIRQEVDTFMFEGHDTVTSAISFTLYSLANNPRCQERVVEELEEIFGNDTRAPTHDDLQNMKYLEMCIKEALRLYPSVPIFGRYLHEDIVIDEHAILPRGCQVFVSTQALHQNIFEWTKPFEFYPEHFEMDEISKRHPYQYIPFSAGPRNCIGMRFAMLELKSSLSRILRNFKLLPASPEVPLKLNVDLILVSETGINIRLEKRQ